MIFCPTKQQAKAYPVALVVCVSRRCCCVSIIPWYCNMKPRGSTLRLCWCCSLPVRCVTFCKAPIRCYWTSQAVLNGSNPSQILAKADAPLFTPMDQPWMAGTAPYTCNVQQVAFLEAAHPLTDDRFRVRFPILYQMPMHCSTTIPVPVGLWQYLTRPLALPRHALDILRGR